MTATAWIFPGQGSQKVGMGKAWAEGFREAREAFEEANEALGEDIRRMCFDGPESDLQLTTNTQPAILAVSIAIARALTSQGHAPDVVAGHSLGEYSALVTAGVLTFADALRLVRLRGQFMQEAVPVGVGAMAAILGLARDSVAEACREAAGEEVCSVANYNSPEQTVIAGHKAAVERAIEATKARGAKRAVLLPVSAPFHCALMRPAREKLEPELHRTAFADARVPVVVNVDATAVRSSNSLREALVRQVDGSVLWDDSIREMGGRFGVRRFVEVGPGNVLTQLTKRILPDAEAISTLTQEALLKLQEVAQA